MKKNELVLIRHGESKWNYLNQFTGWYDVSLSKKGKKEAKRAGKVLKLNNFKFDLAYCSFLKRSIHTLWYILKGLDMLWIPVKKSWRLNERHYGALQGLNKAETALQYEDGIVTEWRRSFKGVPPKLSVTDARYPGKELKYSKLKSAELPLSESLQDTQKRVLPYWNDVIMPNLKKKKRIIVVAHGNSLRALIQYLDKIKEEDFPDLDIPTGIPMVYKFNDNFSPISYSYLKLKI